MSDKDRCALCKGDFGSIAHSRRRSYCSSVCADTADGLDFIIVDDQLIARLALSLGTTPEHITAIILDDDEFFR